MILVTALMKSDYKIARRCREIANKDPGKPPRLEYHMATVCPQMLVHIMNGRTGAIRRANAYDQSVDDWEPFAAKGNYARKMKIKLDRPKEKKKENNPE